MSDHRNLTVVPHRVAAAVRQQRFGHAGAVIWLTGLSAAGKSTLAMGLEERLLAQVRQAIAGEAALRPAWARGL